MDISRAVGIVSVITLFSKITGFMREMAIASGFGAGIATDAYRVAQGVPALFFTSIGAALATVLVPIFTQNLEDGGKDRAFAFVNKLSTITLIVAGVLSVLGIIAAPWVVRVFAPGFQGQAYELSVQLTRLMFPGLLFTALAFLAAGTLQSQGKFAVPALMSLPMNFFIIITVVALGTRLDIWALAWATLIGMAFQYIIQWPALRKTGYRFRIDLDLKDKSIRNVGLLITPVILGTTLLQVNTLVDRMFASNLPAGSISVLDYCNKLTGLVIGVVITTVATVVLPKFSQLAVTGRRDELIDSISRSFSSLNALIIPMAVGLIVLRVPIVRFVYERGAFTSEATQSTSTALLFGSLGLVGVGMREISSRAFYAQKDTVTPMVNGIIAMVVNVVLLFLFVGHFQWGISGMALATACSLTVAGVLLTILLRRKMGGIGLHAILDSWWRCSTAAAGMGTVIWKLHPILAKLVPGEGFFAQAIELSLAILIGVTVYALGLFILRAKEVQYGVTALRNFTNHISSNLRR